MKRRLLSAGGTHTWLAAAVAVLACFQVTGIASDQPLRVGFLAAEGSLEQMGPHNLSAWEVAATLGDATLLLRQEDGTFSDSSGEANRLADFDVLWYHQGDAIARNGMYAGRSLAELRAFAESGRGLLLSGGALALVTPLGLESEMRPQRRDLDNWRDVAGMVPVETEHPAFRGLKASDGLVLVSRGGCRAVADFYWGGPGNGMLLARTPGGPENPLVEYSLGKGRVIVFGWRWPDYADTANDNSCRENLLRLTSNLLDYLADSRVWREAIVRSDYPPLASLKEPGVSRQQWRALRMAIEDLSTSFPDRYARGGEFLQQLNLLRTEQDRVLASASFSMADVVAQFVDLKQEALLANPLLDFDRLLMIRRRADRLGLPLNFNSNPDLPPTGYDNSLVTLSPVRPDGKVESVFRPKEDRFVGDIDLHYDADRMLLSMPDTRGRWGVTELNLENGLLTPLALIDEPDVHNYDACYLPDDRVLFTSTAPFVGVPCVGGRSKVANLYLREHDGRIRRLTNDQDHNWCPTVLNNGRILYQRWEYADIAHAFTRLLFHCNPDGSHQMEYYGSNSFWPTAMFFARPVPDHPTKVVAIVGGHHEAPRQGELVIFDPAKGRHEASGAIQRVPGYGKPVRPVILDGLIGNSWPRFLHPYPLSENYFLVSCKPTSSSLWGVYLVDVFDNFVLLHEEKGQALLEPIPVRRKPRPPIVADLADPDQKEAEVIMTDVYRGGGLRGVPRGSVKSLRLISYEFTFHGFGGEPDRVGFDGPWDVKRVLGTVPVEPDGSAYFRVPATTPIGIQPLDSEGKALALMRSWFTAVPGEVLSCVGCHESQNTVPPYQSSPLAVLREPSQIKPWYGAPRGFSFKREVQPVLDAYCVGCHTGPPYELGCETFDLTARPAQSIPSAFQMHFTPSYMELRRFVHTPTLESDAHLLPPRAFHADTSKLVQILRDGHYGVRLSDEAWDRLVTWIDLNAPAHGSWQEVVGHVPEKAPLVAQGASRRRELHRKFAGIDENLEAVYPAAVIEGNSLDPSQLVNSSVVVRAGAEEPNSVPSAPLRAEDSIGSETSATTPLPNTLTVQLADDIELELVHVKHGEFILGSERGYPNERPAHRCSIETGFWMARREITNRQYSCFDPSHDSGLETGEQYQFGDDERGHLLNRPEQPVVRVSWNDAMAFCRWLSERTGKEFTLPTEQQWEYSCRAGTSSSLWYGTLDTDFSNSANLSDATHYTVDYPHVPTALPSWRPADIRFDDRWRVSAAVGTFAPNPWGLFDMHGNVSEWTRSTYALYAGNTVSHPTAPGHDVRKVVRGGSWYDRPRRARSAFRLHYRASQAIHDVGFRVLFQMADQKAVTSR